MNACDRSHDGRLAAAEQLISQLEISDRAIGAYLGRCVDRAARGGAAAARACSPAWYRARISEWCTDPTVRTAFGQEAVATTWAAVADLEDELLRALVEDLIDMAPDGDKRRAR